MISRDKMPLRPREVVIVGYGYYRSCTEHPAFSLGELATASSENGYNTGAPNFYKPVGGLATAGYLSRQVTGVLPVRYRFEQPGFDPLITSLMYGVRQLGSTLPDLLRLQVSVDAVVDYANFLGLLEDALLTASNDLAYQRVPKPA